MEFRRGLYTSAAFVASFGAASCATQEQQPEATIDTTEMSVPDYGSLIELEPIADRVESATPDDAADATEETTIAAVESEVNADLPSIDSVISTDIIDLDQPYLGTNTVISSSVFNEVEVTIFEDLIPPVSSELLGAILPGVVEIEQVSTIDEVNYLIRGSGFLFNNNGDIQIVTAGHVLMGMNPESLVVTHAEMGNVEWTSAEHYLSPAFSSDQNTLEDAREYSAVAEDLGIIDVPDTPDNIQRALQPIEAIPAIGTLATFVNFQDGQELSNPVVFNGVISDTTDTNYIGIITDVTPGEEEDDLRPGGSGGLVVTPDGKAIGLSFASNNDAKYDRPVRCEPDSSYFTSAIDVEEGVTGLFLSFMIDKAGSECEERGEDLPEGAGLARVRGVDTETGNFTPNHSNLNDIATVTR